MEDLEPKYELSDTGFPIHEPVPYFALSLKQPNRVRLVNVGPEIVRCVHERLEQLVPVDTFGYVMFKDYQVSFTGRFNIYDIILDKCYFDHPTNSGGNVSGENSVGGCGGGKNENNAESVSKEDMTLIKVVFCRLLGALFCYGYDVIVSTDLARDCQTSATIFFRFRQPQDLIPLHYYSHKFICVAPFSTDTLLLINVPKVAVEPILKTIHLTWSPGIKCKQTLADDERSVSVVLSVRLNGTPWPAEQAGAYTSGKSAIQARLIILDIARILAAFKWRLAVNVNFNGATDSFFFQWCPNLPSECLEEAHLCALLLSRYDRLRLLQLPNSLVPVIKECVNQFWYLQLLKQREYHGTTEFKLGGCPWWADGNDAVESRYFVSCLIGALRTHGWEVSGTVDLSRHNVNDKSAFLLRQCTPQSLAHMCISFSKTNRIRLIVSSSDISEEEELQLTTRMNETIKQHWVALGPRNYGKSIEWKLEGDPWYTEGLYSDHTRGIYLLCLLLDVIQPLGWRLVSSADVSAKNMDPNERGYVLAGKPEDMHTWFFLYDENLRKSDQMNSNNRNSPTKNIVGVDFSANSNSVPNLDQSNFGGNQQQQQHQQHFGGTFDDVGDRHSSQMMRHHRQSIHQGGFDGHQFGGDGQQLLAAAQRHHSRSVPSVVAAAEQMQHDPFLHQHHFHQQQQQHQQQQFHGYPPQHNPQHAHFHPHHRGHPHRMPQFGGSHHHLHEQRHNQQQQQQPSFTHSSHRRPDSGSGEFFDSRRGGGSHLSLKQEHFSSSAYGNQDPHFYYNNNNGYPPYPHHPPHPRCSSSRHLTRQSSAGSLPPDSTFTQIDSVPHEHLHHEPHFHQQHVDFYDGYKSDGEGYNLYRREEDECRDPPGGGQRDRHNIYGGVRKSNNGYASDGEGYQIQKRISKSGKFGSQSSSLYKDSEDRLKSESPLRLSDHRRPEISDEEDEVDDEEDEDEEELRMFRSGRGRESQTPESCDDDLAAVIGKNSKSEDENEVAVRREDEVEGGEEIHLVNFARFQAATTTTTATTTLRDDSPMEMGKQTSVVAGDGGGRRRSVSRGSRSCDELQIHQTTVEVVEQQTARKSGRLRRSNSSSQAEHHHQQQQQQHEIEQQPPQHRVPQSSRGLHSSTSGERSDSQMGQQQQIKTSSSNRRSAALARGRSVDGGGGFRSEGSNDSPQHDNCTNRALNGQAKKLRHHAPPPPPPRDLDAIELADAPTIEIRPRSASGRGRGSSNNNNNNNVKTVQYRQLTASSSGGSIVGPSKSLNSFERQESTASFQSGQSGNSSHSAPGGHHHQQQQQGQFPPPPPPLKTTGYPQQKHQQHCRLQQQQQPQHPMTNHHHQRQQNQQQHLRQHHHHRRCQLSGGQDMMVHHHHHPPPPPVADSCCSTQSSSSSASVPPDYATCGVGGIPPSYDQAMIQQHHRQQQQRFHQHHHENSRAKLFRRQHSLQQQHQPPQHQSATSKKHHQMDAAAPGGVQQQQQQSQQQQQQPIRNNQLYYMGEFYG